MIVRLALLVGLSLSIGCQKSTTSIDPEKYRQEIGEWRKERLDRLTSEDGWLTLIGLFWLKEGENTIGSDSSSTVILPPEKAPKVVGPILLQKGSLRFKARPGSGVTYNNAPVTSMALQSDEASQGPTILRIGTLSFYALRRGDQYAVRVKDSQSPGRMSFKGLEYFPINPAWRFEARFEPYVPPKFLEIASQVGTMEKDSCPGALVFEMGGKTYRLDALIEKGREDQLFIMFADETSGEETYAVGRQLYTSLPDSNNQVILDFNKAYNWPCVFTDFATCPIPPLQNRLSIRVEAGEKMYRGH